MIRKSITLALSSCAFLVAAHAATTTTGFGTPPGMPANGFGGSGIPINTSEYVQVTGLPGGDLVLGLAATAHGPVNPAPSNNGAGTYSVLTGLDSTSRSFWNFDFYIRSDAGFTPYVFQLTEKNVGNGQTFSFNPLAIPDNSPLASSTSAGNSESLDFGVFGGPIGYNPNLDDTYVFTLTATSGNTVVASDSITVVAGKGASVPDGGATALLLGAGFATLAALRRKQA